MTALLSPRRPHTRGRLHAGPLVLLVGLLLAGLRAELRAQTPRPAAGERTESVGRTGASGLAGTVHSRSDEGVRPLPAASVEIIGTELRRSVLTDELGRYAITGLPEGAIQVRVSHPGHAAVTVHVRLVRDASLSLDLELELVPVELPGLLVASEGVRPSDPSAPSDPTLGPEPDLAVEMLDVGPGLAAAGIANAVGALPGNDPADPSDVLFMRGSTTELKLVLLDGVPVVTPFQVGGLLRSFEPGVLQSARFHLGGAPARYDGGLTHILDLRTRAARRDRVRASGSVDLLATTLAAEIPLGDRAGVLAAGRHLHDFGQAPLGGARPYGYDDLLVSVDVEPASSQRLRATGFWNAESVRLDYTDAPALASWGNTAGAVTWEGTVGAADVTLSAGGSRYEAVLPLSPSPTEADPDPSDVLASAHSERARFTARARWGDPGAPVQAGLSFEEIGAGFAAELVDDGTRSTQEGRRSVVGAFADLSRTLAPGIVLRGGLRADLFEGDAPRLAPRISLSWTVGPSALLTFAGGRYHQVVQALVVDPVAQPGSVVGADGALPVARADHVVLSLDQRFGSVVALGLDGYWKRFDGTRARDDRPLFNSGVNVQVRAAGGRLSGWVGYELSWFWSAAGSYSYSSDFAGRHLLSAGLSGTVRGPVRAQATLSYGAGLPSAGVPFGAQAEGLSADGPGAPILGGVADGQDGAPPPDDSFLRLDLEVHVDLEQEWGSHKWRLRPYVRLLNPLARRDALFYAWRPGSEEGAVPLAERPVVPIVGVAVTW
ncbi:MAG TPA: carboxypeptidase-like regulatory domain-containing protein [Longimicrobiales bacterium]|nr:carboxypeptidase-like regulatory domain-containing protein [Longimicrobiales bacterium]